MSLCPGVEELVRLAVKKITDVGAAYKTLLAAGQLNDCLAANQADSMITFSDDVRVAYRLSRAARKLMLDGAVTGQLSLRCGRCLKTYQDRLEEDFNLVLTLVDADEALAGDDLELDEEQISQVQICDGEIDLKQILQEQVLMGLPLRPVCARDCAGLCPHCGTDLNLATCDCEPKPFNNRFGKLKSLNLDGQGK